MAGSINDRARKSLIQTHERARPRWRDLAKSLLPVVYNETLEVRPSTYTFMAHLRHASLDAHQRGDTAFLCKAYAFVYWAYDHPSKDLWNSAAVSFLEHAFEGCHTEEDVRMVAAWMRSDMIETAVDLMRFCSVSDDFSTLVKQAAKNVKQSHVGDVNRTLQVCLQSSGVC
jgi:hypothetical protein